MTRTSRAAYPRAINKDRSKSRSGLDPNVRKGGAGYHNWGSIADEAFLEAAAIVDEQQDKLDEKQEDASPDANEGTSGSHGSRGPESDDEELAKKFRKNALKKKAIDLVAIARTSSAVSAPSQKVAVESALDNSSDALYK